MNNFSKAILFSGLLAITACKEKVLPPDACACAKERYSTGMKGPNTNFCDSMRQSNPQFDTEFQKCYYKLNFGGDSTTTAQDEKKMEVMSGPSTGGYNVSSSESVVTWVGREASGKTHTGNVKIKSGTINVENGRLLGGQMVLDMNTIVNTDIKDDGKAKLEGHLKSPDFFDVSSFPEATYTITSVSAKNSREYNVNGNLTIKGVTQPCSAEINISTDGSGKLGANGLFKVDRSLYNVKFRSGKFETGLGDKLINDEILIHFTLVGTK